MYEEKLITFQTIVISLREKHGYLLSQIEHVDQTLVSFDMLSSVV
jgi:hypothetical protein